MFNLKIDPLCHVSILFGKFGLKLVTCIIHQNFVFWKCNLKINPLCNLSNFLFLKNSGPKLIAYIIHQKISFVKSNLKITSIIYYIIHQLLSKPTFLKEICWENFYRDLQATINGSSTKYVIE